MYFTLQSMIKKFCKHKIQSDLKSNSSKSSRPVSYVEKFICYISSMASIISMGKGTLQLQFSGITAEAGSV